MDRYTRRKHFERLCNLRDSYARLGADDATSVITIEAVIALATELLERDATAALDASPERPSER